MVPAPETTRPQPSSASTVCILSQLPVALCDQIIQSVTGTTHSFEDDPYHPWRISNRYYRTTVYFHLVDSPEHLLNEVEHGLPAAMLLVDSSKTLNNELFDRIDSNLVDIPVVLGKSVGASSRPPDELADQCLDAGWEYIDVTQTDKDDSGGQTGLARLAEALQAHVWPDSQMEPRRLPLMRETDSHTEDLENNDTVEASRPTANDTVSAGPSGFEDDFAPFVSAANVDLVAKLDTRLTTSAINPFDEPAMLAEEDELEDPTSQLASMFAALSGYRDQAMSISDDGRRKDFAADVALRFAKQLDALLDDDPEETQEVSQTAATHRESQV